MNECVVVKDEKITTQRIENDRKDLVMAEMTLKILKSEKKIDELFEIVKKLNKEQTMMGRFGKLS